MARDEWGECITRITYCAFNALSFRGMLDLIIVDKAVASIQKGRNLDGGFGVSP